MDTFIKSDPEIITIITPINKNVTSNSHRDYLEQKRRSNMGEDIVWDDAKGNPTHKIGGLFAFVRNNILIDFHMIIKKSGIDERLSTWSDNVGQGDRNVLTLSPLIYTMNWDEWLQLGCPKKVQGTSRVVSAHKDLVDYFYSKIGSIEYSYETGELIFNV